MSFLKENKYQKFTFTRKIWHISNIFVKKDNDSIDVEKMSCFFTEGDAFPTQIPPIICPEAQAKTTIAPEAIAA